MMKLKNRKKFEKPDTKKKQGLELSLRELKNQIRYRYNKSFKRWVKFSKKVLDYYLRINLNVLISKNLKKMKIWRYFGKSQQESDYKSFRYAS